MGQWRINAIKKLLPEWLRHYRRVDFPDDLLAGVVVAILLVPQSMAYALLAGLPAQTGLYAAIMPPLIYGLFGSSTSLAVGPVALVSLLVSTGLGSLGELSPSETLAYALTLAFLVGVFKLMMSAARLGSLVNLISHPVLSGFTSAAAILIAVSQLGNLFGISLPRQDSFFGSLESFAAQISSTHIPTLIIGAGSLTLLLVFKYPLKNLLMRAGISRRSAHMLSRSGPLAAVLIGILILSATGGDQGMGISIVGNIPAGLPTLSLPFFDLEILWALTPTALTIAMVSYLESISVAKSLAARRREKIDANRELAALGLANLSAAFSGGYPVTGGLSRSIVNHSVGARTGIASIITALLIAVTAAFFTPAFYLLPKTVLAAIILVAVSSLIDLETIKNVWLYSKAEAVSMLVTFISVLGLGVERGILVGVGLTLALYIWRTSQPHIAIVGQVEDSEHYRNVLRHEVTTHPQILALRIDENLYFANIHYLDASLREIVAAQPDVRHLVLICSAINYIDASALETLSGLSTDLRVGGVELHLAEIKGPVMDRLSLVGFDRRIGADHIHLSTHRAIQSLASA
jgi:SulP family sulfate permease